MGATSARGERRGPWPDPASRRNRGAGGPGAGGGAEGARPRPDGAGRREGRGRGRTGRGAGRRGAGVLGGSGAQTGPRAPPGGRGELRRRRPWRREWGGAREEVVTRLEALSDWRRPEQGRPREIVGDMGEAEARSGPQKGRNKGRAVAWRLADPCCAPALRSLGVALVKSHPHLPWASISPPDRTPGDREPDRDWRGKPMGEIEARVPEGQKEGLGTFA